VRSRFSSSIILKTIERYCVQKWYNIALMTIQILNITIPNITILTKIEFKYINFPSAMWNFAFRQQLGSPIQSRFFFYY